MLILFKNKSPSQKNGPGKFSQFLGPFLANFRGFFEILKAKVIKEVIGQKVMRITQFLKSNWLLPWLLRKVIDYSNQLLFTDYSKGLIITHDLLLCQICLNTVITCRPTETCHSLMREISRDITKIPIVHLQSCNFLAQLKEL